VFVKSKNEIVSHGLGNGNGSLIENVTRGTVQYRPTGKLLPAFEVRIADVIGVTSAKSGSFRSRVTIHGQGTVLAEVDKVSVAVAPKIADWFKSKGYSPIRTSNGAPSLADELSKFVKVSDSGVLTPKEFETQKAKFEELSEPAETLEDQWESPPDDQRETPSDLKALIRCPWCAEEIFAAAKKCKHCGEFLTAEVERPLTSADLRRTETHVEVWPGIGGIICPHCQTRGQVTTKAVKLKKGVSGAKATAMLMTAGLSIFATGLSRKEEVTEARCGKCTSVWHF
jgi:hypothetical protein